MNNIEDLKDEIRLMDSDKAVEIISEQIARQPDNDELYLLRGMKHWGAGHRAEAIKDYLEAVRLNPESRARAALDQANSILDFYDKNQFNP